MDYYQVLQLNRNASTQEIRQAYKRLALLYHPDKTQGDDQIFKQLVEAYTVLSDETSRKAYDETLPSSNPELDRYISIFENWMTLMYEKLRENLERQRREGGDTEDANLNKMKKNTNVQNRAFVKKVEKNTNASSPSPQLPRDIRLKVSVSLDDVYAGNVKKVAYKVQQDGQICTKQVVLDLSLAQSEYVFPRGGDEGKGTLYIHLDILPHPSVQRSPSNTTDLVMYRDISLFELYYGVDTTIPYLAGDTLTLKKQFFTSGCLRLPDDHTIFVQEIAEYGLPYVCQEDLRYGSLFVFYRLVLPKLSPSLLNTYELHHGIKTYFQTNRDGS